MLQTAFNVMYQNRAHLWCIRKVSCSKKSSWTPCKEVHFIYSWKFRNRLLPDRQKFIEQFPVYEKMVKYLQGQKHPDWRMDEMGEQVLKLPRKISETSTTRKSVVLFPFQTTVFQYFTRSTVRENRKHMYWLGKGPTTEERYFFVIKPTSCTNFTNLFFHEILHVSDSSSVHHQEFIHCTFSNGICHTGL